MDVFGWDFPAARVVLAVAIDVVFKATCLLGLTLVAHAILGRRRALVRSALWHACLAGLLFMPAASWGLPRLRVAVLPTSQGGIAVEQRRDEVVKPDARVAQAQAPPIISVSGPPFVDLRVLNPLVAEPMPARSRSAGTVADQWRPDRPALLIGVYLGIAAILFVRLACGLVAVGRLRRACERVDLPGWVDAVERWRTRLKITREVMLLRSDRVSVPLVLGWLRPAIILPGTLVKSTDPEVVDAVLSHELGHVKRGDYGWNLVQMLVRIIDWPPPPVWLIGRMISALCEQACDELCVHVLGGSEAYRRSLVEVASGLVCQPDPAIGLAMARTTNLSRRLAWIVHSNGAPRCLLRWPARCALTVMVVAAAGMLGSIELARKTAKASEPPPAKVAEPPKDRPVDAASAIEIVIIGTDTNKPLVGSRVRTSMDFVENLWKADSEGRVRIDLSQRVFKDSFNFDVWADGYVQQRHYFGSYDPENSSVAARITVALLPGEETLGGKVTNEEGQPIAGARVVLWGYLGEKKERHEGGYLVDTTTDDDGQWRCGSCRKMTFAYLYLSHPDYVADEQTHPRAHGQPEDRKPFSPNDSAMKGLRDFSDVQVMTRGVAIVGRVTDKLGRPVANAEVGRLEANHLDSFSCDVPKTVTGTEGRFVFPHVHPGNYALQVKARGHAPELKLVTLREKSESVSIELAPPNVLAGRFIDTKGSPIEGAYIYMSGWRGSWALGVNLKTDVDGRFRWEDAPADSVQITAGRDGYDGVYRHNVVASEGEVKLTLKRVLTISGSLTGERTGKPVEQPFVEMRPAAPTGGVAAWSPKVGILPRAGQTGTFP